MRQRPSDSFRSVALIIMAFAAAVIGAFYFVFDPEQFRWMPQCMFLRLTGYQCPGCGSQRMLHALLHGDLAAAWHANAYLLAMLPVIIFMGWLDLTRARHPRLYRRVFSPPVLIVITLSLVIWALARNFL